MFNLNKVSPQLLLHHILDQSISDLILHLLVHQVRLHFTDGALRLVAKKAIAKSTGARGLRAILETVLLEAMYEVGLLNCCTTRCRVEPYILSLLLSRFQTRRQEMSE